MTQNATVNLCFFKRITHVAIVALCTASSLVLIGAVPASWALGRKAPVIDHNSAVVVATPVEESKSVATDLLFSLRPQIEAGVELLQSVAAAAPKTRIMRMEVTAYCPCTKCCGPKAQGITASGKHVSHNNGKFVAADTTVLPFGTKLAVPGYANEVPVEVIDRGGAIKGNKLDLYFPTHAEALVWGRQHVDVVVYE